MATKRMSPISEIKKRIRSLEKMRASTRLEIDNLVGLDSPPLTPARDKRARKLITEAYQLGMESARLSKLIDR